MDLKEKLKARNLCSDLASVTLLTNLYLRYSDMLIAKVFVAGTGMVLCMMQMNEASCMYMYKGTFFLECDNYSGIMLSPQKICLGVRYDWNNLGMSQRASVPTHWMIYLVLVPFENNPTE